MRGLRGFGGVYRFEPEGRTFQQPASLRWRIDDEDAYDFMYPPRTVPIVMAFAESGGALEDLGGAEVVRDAGGNMTAEATISHFSDVSALPISRKGARWRG